MVLAKSNGYMVTPWNDESKRILDQIFKQGKAFTRDTGLPRAFGARYPELVDNGFLAIARAKKKKETVFVPYPDVMVIPMPISSSRNSGKMKYKFHKIF